MKIFNKYIFSLLLSSAFINILLAFLGQNNLEIYFIINILSYLMITLLYVHLNPRAKGALSGISAILFGSFMVIVIIKVLEILY